MTIFQQKTGLAVGLMVVGLLGGGQLARAGFSLGDAVNYAVLYEGNQSHQLQINSSVNNNNNSGYAVTGNIGLGNPNGSSPTLSLNNPTSVNGNVNFAGTINMGGNVLPTGSVNGGVSQVQADLNYLNNLSSTLGAETGTSLAINIGNNGTQTINASAGTLDGSGNRVFTVTSMSFVNGSTLVINGSASDYVVLNFDFNTHFAGSILLSGGITSDQVLFNLTGGAQLVNGDTLQTAANKAIQYGTYLDPNGKITLNSVTIYGRVFGGDSSDMQIVSGSNIIAPRPPVVPEASTVLAGALLLVPLGVSTWRRFRKSGPACPVDV